MLCAGGAQSTIGAIESGCLRRQCFWYTKQNRADMFVNLRSIEVGGDAMAFSTGTVQANAFG
jgi:hypothetical protein